MFWEIEEITNAGDYLFAKVSNHPNADSGGRVLLHRIVMENYLGRLLTTNEIVHHKDKDTNNNDIDNLEVLTPSEHSKLHRKESSRKVVKLQCPNCGRFFIRNYRDTHLVKGGLFTSCTRTCRALFSAKIQYKGITPDVKSKIERNIIDEFVTKAD